MYLNYLFYIFFVVLFTSCKFAQEVSNADFRAENQLIFYTDTLNPQITFKSFSAPRVNFRFDHRGVSASLRGSLTASIDSFIYLHLFTPMGSGVLEFYADPYRLVVFDIKGNQYFAYTYPELAEYISVPLSFRNLQFLIIGNPHYFIPYSPQIVLTRTVSSNRSKVHFSFSQPNQNDEIFNFNYIFRSDFNLLEYFEILTHPRTKTLSATYRWSSPQVNRHVPHFLDFEFLLNRVPVECFMEYRKVSFNTFATQPVGSNQLRSFLNRTK